MRDHVGVERVGLEEVTEAVELGGHGSDIFKIAPHYNLNIMSLCRGGQSCSMFFGAALPLIVLVMYTHLTYFADSTCKSLFITAMVAIYAQVTLMFISSTKYWRPCCFISAIIIGVISTMLACFLFYLAFISSIATPVLPCLTLLGLLARGYLDLYLPCALFRDQLLHSAASLCAMGLVPDEGLFLWNGVQPRLLIDPPPHILARFHNRPQLHHNL